MVRRILVAAGLVVAVMLAGQSAVRAAPPSAKSLWLANYTVSVGPPSAPVDECIYSTFSCGVVVVRATFGGLKRISGRPPGGSPGPSEGNLMGTTQVARTYGCQDASGKRLRSFDRTVAETVELDTRRSSGFLYPPLRRHRRGAHVRVSHRRPARQLPGRHDGHDVQDRRQADSSATDFVSRRDRRADLLRAGPGAVGRCGAGPGARLPRSVITRAFWILTIVAAPSRTCGYPA